MKKVPMLAGKYDEEKLILPSFASPKIDGFRVSIHYGSPLSRTLKNIPNRHINKHLSHPVFDGLDAEITVGDPTASNVFNVTSSHVTSHDKEFPFTVHVFDLINHPGTAEERNKWLGHRMQEIKGLRLKGPMTISLVPQTIITDLRQLQEFEETHMNLGYEGVILKRLDGHYKHGRSTTNEGLLIKVKRFVDSEFVITGFEEQMKNNNEKTLNQEGKMRRSSHKANKEGKGTLGVLVGNDVYTGELVRVGTGISNKLRDEIWSNRSEFMGKFVIYKHFPIGAIDAPRQAFFKGFRSPVEM